MERQQYGFTLPISLVILRPRLLRIVHCCRIQAIKGTARLSVSGNFVVCRKFCPGEQSSSCNAKNVTVSCIFLFLSWWVMISFGIAVILIGTATSMSQTQHFGEGWLDGECYIIKGGVYTGSGILILITGSLKSEKGQLIKAKRCLHKLNKEKQIDIQAKLGKFFLRKGV
ncbi:hypothetical protein RJ639_013442 [Escallonia herrerae]|uniref:Uncharacterized protein n=1 Tax=Escallonia herrerae TaxID=1293975 RepID=A0AA88VL02_9ASTE|nr:hypothetical protein RJ639_013442 [Escallonia herrerae]